MADQPPTARNGSRTGGGIRARIPGRHVLHRSVLGLAVLGSTAAVLVTTPVSDTPQPAAAPPPLLAPWQAPPGLADVRLRGQRWNVVVVMTDDQNRDMTLDMPALRDLITRHGVEYPNAFVQSSTCCPSRASFLTGLFVGRHGVQDNDSLGAPGGYPVFRRNGDERRTLAVELQRAGYTTGLFGKYLNEYGTTYHGGKPAGWDVWRAFTSLERHRGYRGFAATFPDGRRGVLVNTAFPHAYSTRWTGHQAAGFIRRAPRRKPVFVVYTPYAPHSPAKPEHRYRDSLVDDGWWLRDPGFQEADATDKPLWVRRRPQSEAGNGGRPARLALRQRETLRSVDEQIADIVAALKRTGRWNRTLFVFTSDNGLMNGVHREPSKYVPYRRATEVPLIVRYGTDRPPLTDHRVAAANVDVTATILAVAGRTQALRRIDGVPLVGRPGRKGVPLTGPARDGDGWAERPPYCGWRSAHMMFVRYGSGEEEFYDYRIDPYELDNRIGDPALVERVAEFRARARRACSPPPAGYGPSFDSPRWTYRDRDQSPRVAHVPRTSARHGGKRKQATTPEP